MDAANFPRGIISSLRPYAVDSSLALYPWANWTGSDAAVKPHASLDLRRPLPAFVAVAPLEYGDVVWLDEVSIELAAFMA